MLSLHCALCSSFSFHSRSTSFSLPRSSSSFFFRLSLSFFRDARVSPFWSPWQAIFVHQKWHRKYRREREIGGVKKERKGAEGTGKCGEPPLFVCWLEVHWNSPPEQQWCCYTHTLFYLVSSPLCPSSIYSAIQERWGLLKARTAELTGSLLQVLFLNLD